MLYDRTIVIDAGKTFQAAAVEWFPKFGLRKIDALLITHAHADGKKPDTMGGIMLTITSVKL